MNSRVDRLTKGTEKLKTQKAKSIEQLAKCKSALEVERHNKAKALERMNSRVDRLTKGTEKLKTQKAESIEQLAKCKSALEAERQKHDESKKSLHEKSRLIELLTDEAAEHKAQLSAVLTERVELEQLLLTISSTIDRTNRMIFSRYIDKKISSAN